MIKYIVFHDNLLLLQTQCGCNYFWGFLKRWISFQTVDLYKCVNYVNTGIRRSVVNVIVDIENPVISQNEDPSIENPEISQNEDVDIKYPVISQNENAF